MTFPIRRPARRGEPAKKLLGAQQQAGTINVERP